MNIDTTREDQLMAALCHASAMVPLIGMVVPLAVWLSQRERSGLLRFQAVQALVYQLVGLVAYFVLMGCYMASMVLMFPIPFLGESLPRGNQFSPQLALMILAMVLFFGAMLLIGAAYSVGGPIYVLIALVGGWRVLKGHDFHYPLLGKMVTRWTDAPPTSAAGQAISPSESAPPSL